MKATKKNVFYHMMIVWKCKTMPLSKNSPSKHTICQFIHSAKSQIFLLLFFCCRLKNINTESRVKIEIFRNRNFLLLIIYCIYNIAKYLSRIQIFVQILYKFDKKDFMQELWMPISSLSRTSVSHRDAVMHLETFLQESTDYNKISEKNA